LGKGEKRKSKKGIFGMLFLDSTLLEEGAMGGETWEKMCKKEQTKKKKKAS